jgi:hypothetical protein
MWGFFSHVCVLVTFGLACMPAALPVCLANKSTFRFAPSSFAQFCWIEIKEDNRNAFNLCPLTKAKSS